MKKFILLLALLCFRLLPSSSQPARMYTSADGLPNSRINCIMQDRTGFIWISSGNGLARFDGSVFRHFQADRSAGWALAGDLVLRTFQDSRGTMWVATASGLQTYDPSDGTFSTVILDEDAPFASTSYHITDIAEVRLGAGKAEIWIGTYQNGIYILDADGYVILRDRSSAVNSLLASKSVSRIFPDSHGQVWTASGEGGLQVFNAASLDMQSGIMLTPEAAGTLPDALVSEFMEDKASGDIIICSSNFGIFVFDSSTLTVTRSADALARSCRAMSIVPDALLVPSGNNYLIGTENQGLKSYNLLADKMSALPEGKIPFDVSKWKIHSLMTDNQGNIWAGAYERGVMVIPNPMYGFEYTGVMSSLRNGPYPDGCVTSLARDPGDLSLWAGTDGYGLLNIGPDGKRRFYDSSNSALTDDTITSLAVDRRGALWISTFIGGLYVKERGKMPRPFGDSAAIGTPQTVDLTYDASEDILYAGTNSNGLAIIDPSSETVLKNVCDDACKWVSCLYLDRDGLLWVGTYNGPMIYNDRLGRIIRYNMADKSMNARVSCFLEAADGTVWMGTGDGLFAFNRAEGKERRYSDADGLSNNVIYGMLQSPDGDIWISTASGLSRFDPQTGRFSRYYASDGLQENEFHKKAAMIDQDGKMHFGGINGISSFYPASVERKPHDVPTLLFTVLRTDGVAGRDISGLSGKDMVLPYDSNSISVDFTALEFTNPGKVRYEYRLDRLDPDWKECDGALRNATYTDLAPGRYELRVRAYFDGSEDRVSEAGLRIRISPPWFRSAWAIAIYGIVLASAAILLSVMAERSRQRKKRLDKAVADQNRLQAFAEISRQVCTPLNLVVSPIKELRDSETDSRRRTILEMMYRNGQQVQELITQMTDPSRLEGSMAQAAPGPLPETMPETEEGAGDRNRGTVRARRNIVIVDDDRQTREFLRMELGNMYNVKTCGGGKDAWNLILSELPDAVITEALTKDMDGYELCTRIRHNLQTNHIPVIMLTALHDEQSAKRSSDCGADLFLSKPLSMDLLRSSVTNIIATRETMRRKFSSDAAIAQYGRPSDAPTEKEGGNFEEKVIRIIEEEMHDPAFGVESLSSRLGISRVHLNRKLKERLDTSPGTLIRYVRLKQAATMLARDGLSVSEAARKTGFTATTYFSSCFRESFGMTPKEFVKKYRDSGELPESPVSQIKK